MLRVLRSSAGSGKTHALVKHYLTLALKTGDPSAYGRILALTFTNKAAGEMRERILDYLDGLALGGDLSVQLIDVQEAVMQETTSTGDEVQRRSAKTLSHMLHHWPQFAVSTIDAFTRRVVMPFARDLRLDSELRMTTEEQYYRDQAVERLLEEAGTDTALTELLTAICEDLQEQERDWRVDKPLRELTSQLSKEQAVAHLQKLRGFDHAYFITLQKRLRGETAAFREKIRDLGRNALAAIGTEGIASDDLASGKNGVIGFFRKLRGFTNWIDVSKSAIKARDTDKWASAKATPAVRKAIDRVAPILHDTVSAVEDARKTGDLQRHAIACAVLQDLLPSAALHLLDDQLELIKREDGIAFFSDLVKKVATIVQEEPAPFLYERLGEKYDHFLIDEFQDTSMLQWHALLPLITNALSGTGSALLVGDAKQAIYRWRNGEARQFVMLPELFGKEIMATGEEHESILLRSNTAIEPLTKNYRSALTIIDFNNALFDVLQNSLPEDHQAVYANQTQSDPRGLNGYIQLQCFAALDKSDEEDEDDAPAAPAFAASAVAESLEDGFMRGDIVVLVRTRSQGRAIAEYLVAQGHQVVSPDGLSLGSDIAVRAVMALLTWLHRPDDATSVKAVQYMALLRSTDPKTDPFTLEKPQTVLIEWARDHPRVTTRLPLLASLHAIAAALDLDPAADAFTLGLLNEAHVFAQEHGDAPIAFLVHWKRIADKRAVGGTANDNAIRVMTVHASKGLQFPVVIVPWADMKTKGPRDRVWIDPRAVVKDLPAALIRPGKSLDELGIHEVATENDLVKLDLLDLLYVAFTRPETRLYAGIDGTAKSDIAEQLREHFQLSPGVSREFGKREAAPARKRSTASKTHTLSPTAPHAHAKLAIRIDAPDSWDPADPDPFRSHGRALHAVLARVRTIDDLPDAIAAEADVWGVNADNRVLLDQQLSRLLSQPELAPFFGAGIGVRTETSIIDANGHEVRPDRICSDASGTRVLDIKTGAAAEKHADQVRGYARLLQQLGEPNVSAYLLYVRDTDTSPGTLVTIDL
ncbi:MAG: UvrD-helicase domain-containing protein [Flavobacteriales bacterium]|nr:UvrD-helicase domain-containing protein [Flavobacteriales bacterium]